MLIRNTPSKLLCGFVLCCAVTALGQSLNSNASGAVTSSFVSGAVSASVSANSLASAQSNTTQSSGYGGGRAAGALAGSFARVRVSQHGVQSVRAMHRLQYGTVSAHESPRLSGSQTSAAERYGIAGRPQISSVSPASYSYDFPDSTKGTALLSPPDTGTRSPLDWDTSLSFEFPDLSQKQFLNPTLHVGRHAGKARHAEGYLQGGHGMRSGGVPQQHDLYTLPSSSLSQRLKREGLPQSTLQPSGDLQPLQQ